MPKFFVLSDVHGFYDEMELALDAAGFDANNEDHWLISCGDEWDRGNHPIGVMKFFSSLERKVIIRGNHMELFEDLCYREYPEWHDKSNGTLDTVMRMGEYDKDKQFDLCCERALNRTKKYRRDIVNYFETKNYIFVHSWIPVIKKDNLPAHYTRNRKFEFDPNWRNAGRKEWHDAMWGNPFDMAEKGLNQTGKTIVFGHWATEHKWAEVECRKEFEKNVKFKPYHGEGFIGIDGCTAYSHLVNVIVLEDDFIND